jgi:hypothetical protein
MTDISTLRNLRRIWEVRMYAGWGDGPSATVFLGVRTIQARFDHEGRISVEMDGEMISKERATSYLTDQQNQVQLVKQEALTATEELPIGKARACTLHKIMGKLGLSKPQHYSLAAAALGEWVPVPSLAEINEREARTVWNHLCSLYPDAPETASSLKADHAA